MTDNSSSTPYFPHVIQIDAHHWSSLDLGALSRRISERSIPDIIFYRQLALRINRRQSVKSQAVHAGQLNMYATLLKVFHHLIDEVAEKQMPNVLADAVRRAGHEQPAMIGHHANPGPTGLQKGDPLTLRVTLARRPGCNESEMDPQSPRLQIHPRTTVPQRVL